MATQQGIFYKAAQLDGLDFTHRQVDYGAAFQDGSEISIPARSDSSRLGVIPVSTLAGEVLFRSSWPCRLFQVTGVPVTSVDGRGRQLRHTRGVLSLRVAGELDAREALGPNADTVLAVLDRIRRVTTREAKQLAVAWRAADPSWLFARGAARAAAVNAGTFQAWRAAGIAARTAAGSICGYQAWSPDTAAPAWVAEAAAQAAVVRGRISADVDQVLTDPFESVCGTLNDLLYVA